MIVSILFRIGSRYAKVFPEPVSEPAFETGLQFQSTSSKSEVGSGGSPSVHQVKKDDDGISAGERAKQMATQREQHDEKLESVRPFM